jgi:hypothetical protein
MEERSSKASAAAVRGRRRRRAGCDAGEGGGCGGPASAWRSGPAAVDVSMVDGRAAAG